MMDVKLIFKERAKRLAKLLLEEGVSCFVFTTSVNMYYFTEFMEEQRPRFFGLLIPAEGEPVLFLPEMYGKQFQDTSWISDIITWSDGEDPIAKVAGLFKEKGFDTGTIAIDDPMWSRFLLNLQAELPQARFISGGDFMKVFRRTKSQYEKELMILSGAIADKVMAKAVEAVGEGVPEIAVAEVITNTFKELGGFYGNIAIVGSGAFSALPHYRATDKIITKGDSVVIDFSGVRQKYFSDITRTVFVGKPDAEYLKIYDIVRKAQETAMQAVKPGISCQEIDRISRGIIEQAGYGKYFIHRTGHGIGLEAHEEPYIIEGNELIIEPGMTFSIEPGIYLPGRYGVRIEDCVIVTEDSYEPFTHFTHDLQLK